MVYSFNQLTNLVWDLLRILLNRPTGCSFTPVAKYLFMSRYFEHLIFSLVTFFTIIGRFYNNLTNIFKPLKQKWTNNYDKSTKIRNIWRINWKIRLIGRCSKECLWWCAKRGVWKVTGTVFRSWDDLKNLKLFLTIH